MPGRKPKPTAQHILDGTYREDRHGRNGDLVVKNYLDVPENILPPESLTDEYCRAHYCYHVNLLLRLEILTASDIPEIDMLYETLQQYRYLREKIKEVDPVKSTDDYMKIARMIVTLSRAFSSVARRYYISPDARNRIQLDRMAIHAAERKQSVAARLLKEKKA